MTILFSDTSFSVAYGTWEKQGQQRIQQEVKQPVLILA
jgi:hypothetical protein